MKLVPPADEVPVLDQLEAAVPELSALDLTPETIARLAALHGRVATLLAAAAGLMVTRAARPPAAEPDEALDPKQAAKLIGMSVYFVRDHRDELGGRHEGSKLRFSRRAVQEYLRRKHGSDTIAGRR